MKQIDITNYQYQMNIHEFRIRIMAKARVTSHHVYLFDDLWQKWKPFFENPQEFLESCFRFLLSRESQDHILHEFNVTDIVHYFPDFNDQVVHFKENQ